MFTIVLYHIKIYFNYTKIHPCTEVSGFSFCNIFIILEITDEKILEKVKIISKKIIQNIPILKKNNFSSHCIREYFFFEQSNAIYSAHGTVFSLYMFDTFNIFFKMNIELITHFGVNRKKDRLEQKITILPNGLQDKSNLTKNYLDNLDDIIFETDSFMTSFIFINIL
jgi:hypothetical protein